ncbi:MAG: hypothetical protein EXR27_22515 [Betaproteobacteria bacterium]|nr:hypothetical protein [Betaproteobacteria bacterium]
MSKLLKMVLMIGAVSVTSLAQAQFSNLFGGGGSGSAPSADSIVKNYIEGAKNVLEAQGKLLHAIGKKEEAAKAELEAKNMTEGATKQNLEAAMTTQTESSKLIEDSLSAKGIVLDAGAKIIYAEGLGFMGRGVTKYVALASSLKNFKPSVTSLALLLVTSFGAAAQSAVYIAQSLPGNMSAFSSTLSAAINFANEQGVPIHPDATAALSGK